MKLMKLGLVAMFAASPALAQDLSGTLAKINESNVILIGFQEAAVPFSYLDGEQKPIGYTIEICKKIAEAAKVAANAPDAKIEFVPVTPANRIPLLLNGTIDLHCASATNTEERQKQVAFVNSHFLSANRIVSKKASAIDKIDDLKDKAVVSVAGSVGLNLVNKLNAERGLGIRVLSAKDQIEAFMMVETDRAAAYVLEDVQLAVAVARSKTPADYAISSEALSKPEPFGIIVRKDDAPFKEVADTITAKLYAGPEIETLYKTWFESPVPPAGINFNYPISAELKNAYAHPSSSFNPDDYAVKN